MRARMLLTAVYTLVYTSMFFVSKLSFVSLVTFSFPPDGTDQIPQTLPYLLVHPNLIDLRARKFLTVLWKTITQAFVSCSYC